MIYIVGYYDTLCEKTCVIVHSLWVVTDLFLFLLYGVVEHWTVYLIMKFWIYNAEV